jgi:hypothetical protein
MMCVVAAIASVLLRIFPTLSVLATIGMAPLALLGAIGSVLWVTPWLSPVPTTQTLINWFVPALIAVTIFLIVVPTTALVVAECAATWFSTNPAILDVVDQLEHTLLARATLEYFSRSVGGVIGGVLVTFGYTGAASYLIACVGVNARDHLDVCVAIL